jgi:lysophospholipase
MTVDPPCNRREIPLLGVESRWLASDGTAIRRFDWAPAGIPPRGRLLFLPGRGDFYEKYLEAMGHWQAGGWAVTALDWRGQALSGRLGHDPLTGHIADFAIWVADLAAFWRDWAVGPGPKVAVGHSMGGHLLLRALAEAAIAPDAAVLVAPMLGLHPTWVSPRLMRAMAALMCRLGDPARPAWDAGERPGKAADMRQHLLTRSCERYADEAWWRAARPGLGMGGGSWRWVERAYASIVGLARAGVLEAVRVPLLVLASRVDGLVSWPAIERAAARLPKARLVAFDAEAAHELLREADPVRARVLAEIDSFLDRPFLDHAAPLSQNKQP